MMSARASWVISRTPLHAIKGGEPAGNAGQLAPVRGHPQPLSHRNIGDVDPEPALRILCDLLALLVCLGGEPGAADCLDLRAAWPSRRAAPAIAPEILVGHRRVCEGAFGRGEIHVPAAVLRCVH